MDERDYSQELTMLLAMSPEERKVHFLQEKVDSELYWLDKLVAEYEDTNDIKKIREQRRVAQAWQTRLNAAKKKLNESERSSKPSEYSSS